MVRYKLKRPLAAELVNELVDSVTHIWSNVKGRAKGQLDPKIIQYLKKKCFEVFPSDTDSDKRKDWNACVVAIDDKEEKRTVKRRNSKTSTS